MKIEKLVERELTKEEIESIKRFRSYTDVISFACLRSRVMVMLEGEFDGDTEAMKKKALECMNEAISTPPDFDTFELDDGNVLVLLPSGVCAISEEPCEPGFAVYINLRGECLKAADNMEVIAVAYEE